MDGEQYCYNLFKIKPTQLRPWAQSLQHAVIPMSEQFTKET